MSNTFTDEKTLDLVQSTIDGDKNGGEKFKRKLAHFLVDFNVVSYTVSFLVALQFQDFLKELLNFILSFFIDINKYKIISSLISFIIVLILCFLFVQFIFYKYIYTPDVEKEAVLKQALTEKKTEEAKKEISKVPEVKKEIKEIADIEGFYGLGWN